MLSYLLTHNVEVNRYLPISAQPPCGKPEWVLMGFGLNSMT